MYTINYFKDKALSREYADFDVLPDHAILTYPAPTGREVAVARHDSGSVLYGYNGKWHEKMPDARARVTGD